jgi:hypothetical protein
LQQLVTGADGDEFSAKAKLHNLAVGVEWNEERESMILRRKEPKGNGSEAMRKNNRKGSAPDYK